MNETRFALKVGIFVALGILLVAALLLVFSKGLNLFTPTYELRLRSATVGGLKNRATVLLNAVPTGNGVVTEAAPDGRGVILFFAGRPSSSIPSLSDFAL